MIIVPFSLLLLILELSADKYEQLFDKSGLKTFTLMVICFVLWILSLRVLGYVMSTCCVTFAFSKIMKLEGWIKPLVMSVFTALIIYLLFDVWLYIDLPRGILGK